MERCMLAKGGGHADSRFYVLRPLFNLILF